MPFEKARRVFYGAALAALSALPLSCGSTAGGDDWEGRIQEARRRGAPLVRAIYRFKAATGLWPCALDELVPDYAGPGQIKGWGYAWRPSGWWSLKDYGAFPKALLCYQYHGPDEAGWLASDGEGDDCLKGSEFAVPAADVSAEERDAAHLSVLRARVGRYKDRIIHHQGLICWYYTHEDYERAYEACERCLRRWPGHWWPNLMMAYIEQKLNRAEDANTRLARFTAEHDDLNHWYLAGEFYMEAGRLDKAKEALAKAAQARHVDLRGEKDSGENFFYSGDGFAWPAAILCYKRGWLDEALAHCDVLERARQEQHYGDRSYLAIRAACLLAQGKDDEARQTLEPLLAAAKKSGLAAEHIDELDAAINRNDHDFHYDAGDHRFRVLIDYE